MTEPVKPQEGTDTGAPFVAGAGPDGAEQVIEPPKLPKTEAIAAMMRAASGKANEQLGERAKCNLQLTEWEAKMIAPGVRRYLEARPELAATVMAGGDEYLMACVGMSWAGGRMYLERRRAIVAELEALDNAPPPKTPTDPEVSARIEVVHAAAIAPQFYGDPADPSDPRD